MCYVLTFNLTELILFIASYHALPSQSSIGHFRISMNFGIFSKMFVIFFIGVWWNWCFSTDNEASSIFKIFCYVVNNVRKYLTLQVPNLKLYYNNPYHHYRNVKKRLQSSRDVVYPLSLPLRNDVTPFDSCLCYSCKWVRKKRNANSCRRI